MSKKKFVIIDGNAILHRAYHALPPFKTKDGVLVNAVYGFTTTLLKIFKEINPEYIAVAFDKKAPTFRHKMYKAYKATREKKPQELYDQIDYIKKVLSATGIPYYEKDEYEGDDIIATVAELVSKKTKDVETIIVTGDMDALQLVTPRVSVYTFRRGLSDTQIFDPAEVLEKYGLPPEALIDFKGLRGDQSDNIPGVKGVGDVTGSELIKNFGTIEKLYAALEKDSPSVKKISPRVRELLIKYKKDAILGKKLVTLIKNVPIDFSLEEARRKRFPREPVTDIFRSLGFNSLASRINEFTDAPGKADVSAKSTAPSAPSAPKSKIIESESAIIDFVKKLFGKTITLRTRAKGESLDMIAILSENEAAIAMRPKDNLIASINALISDAGTSIVGHDLKRDFRALGAKVVKAKLFDVMIASYLTDPGSRAHDLAGLAFSVLGQELAASKKQQTRLSFGEQNLGGLSSEEDEKMDLFLEIASIPKLQKHFVSLLDIAGAAKLFKEIEMPLLPVLSEMENRGVLIDEVFLKKMSKDFETRLSRLEKDIYKHAGEEFNINSPVQLSKILFEKLEISTKSIKKTAGGGALSTAGSELLKLKGSHPIVDLIFEYRELSKLKSTYIDALPELVNKATGRVHTTFNQAITATGRLSSSNPNLQNIPTKTDLGREIRKAFIAEKGCSLLSADYSQFELRIAAHLSGDKAMIEDFKSGEDIHTRTAGIIWMVDPKDVTKDMRRIAKAINFGVIYGMGPRKLMAEAEVSMEEARDFIDRFFAGRPRLREYIEELKALAAAQGYVETMFGRRRYLPEIITGVPALRAEAERQAVNTPIQGTQADVIKIAMVNLRKILPKEFGDDLIMIMQVHDELVFEIKDSRVHEAAGIIQEIMENAVKLSVPTVVEIDIGKNWGEMRKWSR